MIGDPLADALALPYHPKLRVRMYIYLRSAVFFTLTRIYSNAARWIAPLRRRFIRWHKVALNSFHEAWLKTHKSKMARALRRKERASIIDLGDEPIKADDSTNSLCPFAMTAMPT
jgi:hypothetical protein